MAGGLNFCFSINSRREQYLVTFSGIMLKNGHMYFKTLAAITPKDLQSVTGHFGHYA